MRAVSSHRLRTVVGLALLVVMILTVAPVGSAPPASAQGVREDMLEAAREAAQRPPAILGRERTAVPEDIFAMAGGCYAARSVERGQYLTRQDGSLAAAGADAAAAEPLHFQATDLGSYLLFGSSSDFVAASEGEAGKAAKSVTDTSVGAAVGGLTMEQTDAAAESVATGPAGTATGRGESVVLAEEPGELADWTVTETDDGFRLTLPALEKSLSTDANGTLVLADTATADRFTLELAQGCAAFPEVEVNVDGPVTTGETPFDEVSGYYDGHLHAMAFEFIGGRIRCGRPWHRYGVEFALRGCKEHEIADGRLAVGETALSGRDPVAGHDTNAGWPTFTDWPQSWSLTYEQVYYKWLERAWRGGLRMFTNLLVDNNQLCKLYPYKRNSCNEMENVRLQHQRIHELQDYIDAQYGGPGRGWFRIVTDPFEARRTINEGKLAVILGIEVSVLFDCGVYLGTPKCDTADIDQRLDEVYDMGVRQMELVNKFDNALSGVTGDNGTQGVIVNNGNFLETGRYWPMRSCEDPDTHAHDKYQYNFHDESGAPEEFSGRDALVGMLLSEVGGTGAAPAYGPGPHCSTLGLSPLGEHLIRRMVAKGMIFDPDHMSAIARDQAMDIIEELGYSGVISSHSWADDNIYPRVWNAGGVVTPHGGTSASFVQKWRKQRQWADERYYFGVGFGSDMNGFSTQGAAPNRTENPISYPFTGLGGVTIHKQVSGDKSFDYNVDGSAHYGMYPDFVEDARIIAGEDGDALVADMQRASEAFLQMWERATGIAPSSCRTDIEDLGDDDLDGVRRGSSPEDVLIALGQPAQRTGDTFVYCVDGQTVEVHFGPSGHVQRVR